MRYIRTRDGRIIDTNNYEVKREIYENGELKFYVFWTTRFTDRQVIELFANEVVKKADTIPELCDVIIFKTKDYRGSKGQLKLVDLRIADGTKEDLRNYLVSQMRSELFEFAYLGIETDKGLIYVAKMNEKGELELL